MRVSEREAILRGWIKAPPKAKLKDRASPTHDLLHSALPARLGNRLVREFPDAVPGRRFRLDLAIPDARIAIEIDGYSNHGKTLSGFKRDRVRQNLLAEHHWVVLRYFPGQIYGDLAAVVDQVMTVIDGQLPVSPSRHPD